MLRERYEADTRHSASWCVDFIHQGERIDEKLHSASVDLLSSGVRASAIAFKFAPLDEHSLEVH